MRRYPGVADLLGGLPLDDVTAEFRGVGEPIAVTRIGEWPH